VTLRGLLPLLSKSIHDHDLLSMLRPGEASVRAVPSLSFKASLVDSALPYWIGSLRDELHAPVLLVTPRPERARRVHEDLLMWYGEEAEVYQLPEGEALPFERLMADDATTHGRIRALSALMGLTRESTHPSPIVVASLAALSQRTLERAVFQDACGGG